MGKLNYDKLRWRRHSKAPADDPSPIPRQRKKAIKAAKAEMIDASNGRKRKIWRQIKRRHKEIIKGMGRGQAEPMKHIDPNSPTGREIAAKYLSP